MKNIFQAHFSKIKIHNQENIYEKEKIIVKLHICKAYEIT